MFDSVDALDDCIRIATGVLSTLKIRPERMLQGLSADMLATDLAEYLVRKGKYFFSFFLSLRVSGFFRRFFFFLCTHLSPLRILLFVKKQHQASPSVRPTTSAAPR